MAAALVGAVLMFCAVTPQAKAQAVAVAEVDGHVSDPSGQAIVGATVKMTQVDKHQVRTATTDTTGRFSMPNLAIGPYKLEVAAPGFKEYVQTGIELQVASNVDIPVVMTIGAVTESVSVTANANMVETKDSSIGQVIGTRSIEDLPLNGRNPTQLLTLTGASTSSMTLTGGDLTGSKNMGGSNASGQFSVAGGQANGVNFLLDGGDNNDNFSNVNLPIPFPDAIQEFNVQTNGLPAQYGLHPGGVVNIVTKGGANALHGDVFEFFRNGDLNARQKGDQYGTQPIRDTLKRNQFGGTAGGKIIKDRLFFFAGYQGTRQRSDPPNQTAYTPTAATLRGDFSVVASSACKAKTLKDVTGTPYPGNQIPVSSFDPAGFKLASTYVPTSTDPCGKELFGALANNPDDQWVGRIDWVVSDRHNFYGRYYIYDYTALALFDGHNGLTTATNGNQQRSQTLTIGDNYTFGGGQDVNSFHATANRRRNNRSAATNMFSPADLGVNMFINYAHYTQLSVNTYSGGGFNIGCGSCAFSNFNDNTFQVADDFTMIRGKHQFQFGFDGRKVQFNSFNYQQANGQFTFGGTTTGDGLADLLIGRFSGLTDGNVISDYLRNTAIAAYAQDSIHVAKGFSVNLGIRWEPAESAYDKQGRGNQFLWPLFLQGWHTADPRYSAKAPAGLVFTTDTDKDPYGQALTANHWALFSPRLGMVWDPKGDGRQTVRAAFVLIHDTAQMFYPERWTTNAPYVSSLTINSGEYSLNSGPFSNPFLGYPGGDPFPGNVVFPAGGSYIDVPPNVEPQYMMQWNVSYQRQVGADWLVTANYMGNATRHIWGSMDINPSVPTIAGANANNANARRLTSLANPTQGAFYAQIVQTDDGGNGEYHGLLLSAQHRLSHGVNLNLNYTWSHCSSSWDYAGELAAPLYQNPYNRATGERGNCGFDHRQNFVGTLVATSGGLGENVVKTITKNWQLSPLLALYTGQPVNLLIGKDISLTAGNANGGQGDRAEVLVPDQTYGSPRTLGNYYPLNSFACAGNAPGQCSVFSGLYGNIGRNALYGPGTIQWDMALSRRFKFNERLSLDFRSDFFNIMNHANWNNPATGITTSTFGQVTGFGSPRIIQFSTKFFF